MIRLYHRCHLRLKNKYVNAYSVPAKSAMIIRKLKADVVSFCRKNQSDNLYDLVR